MNKMLRQVLASALTLAACAGEQAELVAPADLVVTNGRIHTVDASQPWVEAVAISDWKYVYVGRSSGVDAYTGSNSEIVDLNGMMAMPGINDTHAHSWQGGHKELYECNFLFTATSRLA